MLLTDPVYVDLCIDVEHAGSVRADANELARRHNERLTMCHWRDYSGYSSRYDVIDEDVFVRQAQLAARFGHGRVDWARWAQPLSDVGYRGWAVLEPSVGPDFVDELREAYAIAREAVEPRIATNKWKRW